MNNHVGFIQYFNIMEAIFDLGNGDSNQVTIWVKSFESLTLYKNNPLALISFN